MSMDRISNVLAGGCLAMLAGVFLACAKSPAPQAGSAPPAPQVSMSPTSAGSAPPAPSIPAAAPRVPDKPKPNEYVPAAAEIILGSVGGVYRQVIEIPPDSSFVKVIPYRKVPWPRPVRFMIAPQGVSADVTLRLGGRILSQAAIPANQPGWIKAEFKIPPQVGDSVYLTVKPGAQSGDGRLFITRPKEIRKATTKRPPIILISIDTLRADHLPVYGYTRRNTAPAITEFARDAFVFDDVSAASPWTLPSHISMLTGTDAFTHKVAREDMAVPDRIPTLAAILKKYNYVTAAMTGIVYVGHKYLKNFQTHFEYTGEDIKGDLDAHGPELIKYIRRHGGEAMFLFFHTFAVHDPYTWKDFSRGIPAGTHEDTVACYDAGILRADRLLGEFFSEMKSLGIYDSSLIIVTSDHGEELGERGRHTFYGHGHSYYQEVIRVPLLIKFPGQKRRAEPLRITEMAGHIDILPTVLDYLGLPMPDVLDGESLIDECEELVHASIRIDSEASHIRPAPEGRIILMAAVNNKFRRFGRLDDALPKMNPASIRHGQFKFITSTWKLDPGDTYNSELYNLASDPVEGSNILSGRNSEHFGFMTSSSMLTTLGDLAEIHYDRYAKQYSTEELLPQEKAQLRALGYIQ